MNNLPITVLLVEDDPADAVLIQEALTGAGNSPFQVEWVTQLSDALKRLNGEAFEAVLLDLTLLDSQGFEALEKLSQAAPNTLILVLSAAKNEETARQALARGAYDYLVKEHVDAHWMQRILRYVIEHKAARDALLKSEARFRAMSAASPLGIFVSDERGCCTYSNAAYHKISGLTFEETLGASWRMAIHPEDRRRVLAEFREARRSQYPFQSEVRFLRKDQSVAWTRLNTAPLHESETSQGFVWTVEDITERKAAESVLRAAEEALFEEKERAQVTLNSIGDAVMSTDLSGEVTYMNLVAEAMTGWTSEEASGHPFSDVFNIINGETRQTSPSPAQHAIDENETVGLAADCVLIRRDGFEYSIEDSAAPIHNRDGCVIGAVIVFHDVSKSRAMALKMTHLAQHDYLTGLPNRVLLTERLSQAIGLANRHKKQVALMFLDLDYFKDVNDSLGHAIGDQLLQSVAVRLMEYVRATDTVCRQGGDEFVILLSEIENSQDAAHISEILCAAFINPHLIGKHELHVTLSIGISIYPDDGATVDAVMRNADTAMYHAKASGRNNYQFFKADLNARAVERMSVQTRLRCALKQEEFLLHYQPQVDLASGARTGVEALIRWRNPDIELVYPGEFVAIAEESGLIVPIGRWVMREACRQVKAWLDLGLRAVPVAVNISAPEFNSKGFTESVALILRETGLPPRYLELELTESIISHDIEASFLVLETLRDMGIKFAIDNYGKGYSNLRLLKRLSVGALKIDPSFIRNIDTDADDAAIVSTVIGMGKNLNLRIIAKGVETPDQLALLRAQQCGEGQGFQFCRPLTARDFALLLNTGNDKR